MSEIDALLSELNQLQTSLDYPEPGPNRTCGSDFIDNQMKNSTSELSLSASLYFNGSTPPLNNLNAHSEDIEAIDQQFDEVLKFLAQSIDSGHRTAAAPATTTTCISSHSSISLLNSDALNKRMDTELSGSGSSNSSGIGDDFYTNNQTTEALITQQQQQQQNPRNLKASLKSEQAKRNSSDSAFMDAMSMPSSLSLTATNRNLNQPLILSRNKMFMSSLANSSESGSSSEPSPVSSSSEQTQKQPTPVNNQYFDQKCFLCLYFII